MRNHFLDSGYLFPSGTVINKEVVEAVLTADQDEYKMCHKLSYTI